jgi:STE24 endopeptidase
VGRPPGDDERARAYHRWQLRLSLASVLLAAAYLAAWLMTGAAASLREALGALTPHFWLQLPLALAVLAGAYRLATLPLAWVSGFWLPRRVGLLRQSLGRWCWDRAKGAALSAGLGLVAAEVLFGLLRATPWWWLWAAGLFLGGYALLALVTPVWLLPLFYRLEPLAEGPLRGQLLALAARAGVPALGVWVADQSRRSRTANAAVTGLGQTRRILLFDTLLAEFDPDEIESVLAHELAHHVHRDVSRGLAVQGALTLATFWVTDRLLGLGIRRLGLDGPADLAGLPFLGLVFLGLGLAALPLANGWSRRVERQADDFAIRLTGKSEAFVSAMERLAALNLAERHPHPVKELFLSSHPSIDRRISRARALAGA